MLSVKQGGIFFYHFLNFWYDSTRDWTQVSKAIGEHSNHHAKFQVTKENNHLLKKIGGRVTSYFPELEPHHQIQFGNISETSRCSMTNPPKWYLLNLA